MKEKNPLETQPVPIVLRMQAIRSKQLRNIYICSCFAEQSQPIGCKLAVFF